MPSMTYYVVLAYDLDREGNLVAHEPEPQPSQSVAIAHARALAGTAAGVIAFEGTGDPDFGGYTEAKILFAEEQLPDEFE